MNFIRRVLFLDKKALSGPPKLNVLYPKTPWSPGVGNVTLVNHFNETRVVVGRLMGQGAYGNVYSGWVPSRGPVAVKIGEAERSITASNLVETAAFDNLSTWPDCSSLVVCSYAVFIARSSPPVKNEPTASIQWQYGIVMELMEGDLNKLALRIQATEKDESAKYIWLIFITLFMLYDLEYLHQKGWAHNDVKPGNFLYTWPDGDIKPKIKITDLGLACSTALHTDRVAALISDYAAATKFRVRGIDAGKIARVCGHTTTEFYQKPEWDSDMGEGTTVDIADNYDNDRYAVAMSVKVLFVKLGFEGQDDTQAPGSPEEIHSRKDLLRAADLPYAFLKEPLRSIAHEFSDVVHSLSANTVTTSQAVTNVALLLKQTGF